MKKEGFKYLAFLSTPSARRATTSVIRRRGRCRISIHALREEGDGVLIGCPAHFLLFLSTPSARRATVWDMFIVIRHC